MNEIALLRARADTSVVEDLQPRGRARLLLDSRVPLPLDQQREVLKVTAGHIDIFAVRVAAGRPESPRRHLFRLGVGDHLLGLPAAEASRGGQVQLLAVGGLGAEAMALMGEASEDYEIVASWLSRFAALIAGPHPSWDIPEAQVESRIELAQGERRRGPARDIAWVTVAEGAAHLMGLEPALAAGSAPVPLTSGMWVEASRSGCVLLVSETGPRGGTLGAVLEQFHANALVCLDELLAHETDREALRVTRTQEQTATRTVELFDRLAAVVVPRREDALGPAEEGDALFGACRLVAEATRVDLVRPSAVVQNLPAFEAVVEIARASRLRVRQTLLRGDWWTRDAGPLLAWSGEERRPVALLPAGRRGYVLVDPATGQRRRVGGALATALAPEAAAFYPGLPSRPLGLRDLLTFSLRHSRGVYGRLLLSVLVLGMLSWVMPLATQVIVTSAIPRTELDQLLVCALALAVTAVAAAGMQTLEAAAMLRIEGLLDWKLQAAIIDRVLRLPASVFRDYTTGDFVDRALGIDAIRRVLTGRVLRGLMSGVFCWFSLALMFYYDSKLALVATGLIAFRGLVIVVTNLLRLYHENQYMNLQGKVNGLVLQLLAGIGKLRVAAATLRGFSVWSERFAVQKRRFVTAQKFSYGLGVFDASFALIAILVIFLSAAKLQSTLVTDVGAFLAFFAAFGQAMAAIGNWTSALSEALVVIPHVKRLRPILASPVEIADDRKPPGPLSGLVEISRLTFRYVEGGPPALDNMSLRIAPGEYVAIVGPSGSGKSSLFRLLLGFERAESGTVFFDGKAIDTIDISALRRQMGVVLQNGRLMTGSIFQNICGGLQLSLDQVWEAARLASLDADIKAMPMGMHTMISEGVSTISGGQRQRIMIARAIARRPRILLLDEATSSLDNQSQAVVSAALGNLNVTRIVIAHRLSTVRDADRIVVLVDGKVVQTGTYDQLSAQPGTFADFARRQLL